MRETGENPVQSRCCKPFLTAWYHFGHCELHQPREGGPCKGKPENLPLARAGNAIVALHARIRFNPLTNPRGGVQRTPFNPLYEVGTPPSCPGFPLLFPKKTFMKLLSFKARRAVAVVIGLVLGAMYAAAQKLDPDTLRTAEVTTLRKHESISANVPVQRMDSMAFKQRGITDTGDALRRLAGVTVRDYGGAGGMKTVSVRGLGAAHTMVTYDGLGMSDVRNGQTDLQRFNIDALAAIELQTLDYARLLCPVRNLAAAVVNLVSPFEQPLRSGKQPLHGTVSLRQAAFNTWNPAASLTVQPSERTQVGAAANWFYADNNYPFYVENGVASEHLRRANSRMQTAQTELHARQRWTHSQLHAAASFYHNHRRLPGPVVLYVNDNNEQLTEQQAFGQARWTWQNKAWSAFAAAKYDWQKSHYTHHNTAIAVGAPRQKYYQREVYLTAGMQRNFSHHIALAYATDYAHTALSSNLPATKRVSRDTWLQSLSASWHAGPVSLTLRGLCHLYANHRPGAEAADNEVRLTPAVSASVRAVGQRHLRVFLRAGYKEAFRMPSFTENYYHHLGSTDLKPELTRQTNLGLTAQTAYGPWQMLLTADAYYNQVEQRIVSIPYNLFVWRTVNLGEVRVGGLDLTLHTTLRVAPRQQLVLTTNYSLQRAADRSVSTAATYGNQLPYTPRHSGAASLAWENPWLSLVAHTTWASERWSTLEHLPATSLPRYSEWGFAAYRSWQLGRHRLDLRADLVNAFNRSYEIVRRYPMPRRAYKLSAVWAF